MGAQSHLECGGLGEVLQRPHYRRIRNRDLERKAVSNTRKSVKEDADIKKGDAVKLTNAIILPAVFFMITCAYGQDVNYDYARGTNFSAYKTYQWVDVPTATPKLGPPRGLPDPPPGLPKLDLLSGGAPSDTGSGMSDDQLISQDIKRAVDEQLAQKGLTRVERNGDLQIAYHAAVREEKSIDLNGMGWGGRGW